MTIYNSLKNDLLNVISEILSLIKKVESIPGISENSFKNWVETCSGIEQQVSEDIVRVAVVGPIKSGKSTFVNSLFKGDYLKRGAGVVTSIVTRIRTGEKLSANLYFKSWDEVNSDIEQALVLFPSVTWRSDKESFDIRRKKDREDLELALATLSPEQLITNDTKNINSVLLTSYLTGYDKVNSIISSETITKEYTGQQFQEHRNFTGDEVLAVYLRDIQLEIDIRTIDKQIEIADCQGSDSPNPLHLAMIQNYLLFTHFIVYVVSSRTGLRRADIKFLSMIKKMGIMDNILFVINCDFSEHESIDNLKTLIKKVEDEISLLKQEPEVYSFSGLFNLFKSRNDKGESMDLSQKDLVRFEQWEKESDFSLFSNRETERFESTFNNKITHRRFALLLGNHLGRLEILSLGLNNLININKDILSKDADSANELIKGIAFHQKKMDVIKDMIRNTLDGIVQKIQQELRGEVDRFFDLRNGELLKNVVDYIRAYQISSDQYAENLEASGFSSTLYSVFQEFKQALDFFMAETINPKVIGFLKEEEKKVIEHLETMAGSYSVMVYDALAEYKNALEELGVTLAYEDKKELKISDVEAVKRIAGLEIPPATALMAYSVRMRTEAIIRLGVYSLSSLLKKIFRKPVKNQKDKELQALKDAVIRMKRETEKSVGFHFKSYKENLKFQYLFKLVDAASNNYYEMLIDQFQSCESDLSKVADLINEKRVDKEQIIHTLDDMKERSKEIKGSINDIGQALAKIDEGAKKNALTNS